MGMWGLGPFDNDSAADYAGRLRDMRGSAERVEDIYNLLTETLNTPLKKANLALHSMGWRLEEAVAAAAIVADAHRGEMRFTDTAYARGVGEDDELGDPPYIGVPQAALVELASKVIAKVISHMEASGAEEMWIENVAAVGQALAGPAAKEEER